MKFTQKAISILTAAVFFTLLAFFILCYHAPTAAGVKNGLSVCSAVIIPALFPFTVAAVFLQKSGGIVLFERILEKPARKLFGLNGQTAAIMLLSLLGGYPVGAKLLASLYSAGHLDRPTAMRLLVFCVNAGPTFYLSVIGTGLFGSVLPGLVMLLCNAGACLILAFITKFFWPPPKPQKVPAKQPPLSDSFVQSVAEATTVMLGICAWVVLFSAVGAVLKQWLTGGVSAAVISAFLEVTGGCIELFKLGCSPVFYAYFIAFGGFSILFQIKYAAGSLRPAASYLFFTALLRGLLSGSLTLLVFRLLPASVLRCMQTANGITPVLNADYRVLFLGAFMAVFLIYTLSGSNNLKKFRKNNAVGLEK